MTVISPEIVFIPLNTALWSAMAHVTFKQRNSAKCLTRVSDKHRFQLRLSEDMTNLPSYLLNYSASIC